MKVLSNVYFSQQQASYPKSHFREWSEYPKVPNSGMALGVADPLAEWRCGYTQ
jgi:hypothetical protein